MAADSNGPAHRQDQPPPSKTIAALVFPGFELLDYFGPLEMFGALPERYRILVVAERDEAVRSTQGPRVMADQSLAACDDAELLWIPGGIGTREAVANPALLDWLRERSATTDTVASVCTGSGLLAAAGILDGRRATSNKRAFPWARSQGASVEWIPKARWVRDGRFWTSAGVAAGIDMALAIIADQCGDETAAETADLTEYAWHRDADWDPFAEKAGLL